MHYINMENFHQMPLSFIPSLDPFNLKELWLLVYDKVTTTSNFMFHWKIFAFIRDFVH